MVLSLSFSFKNSKILFSNSYYKFLEKYINNIFSLNNEKKLKDNSGNALNNLKDFEENEINLMQNIKNEVNRNYKYISNIIDIIPVELIIGDYITFILHKYINKKNNYNKDDIHHKIIELQKLLLLTSNKNFKNYIT